MYSHMQYSSSSIQNTVFVVLLCEQIHVHNDAGAQLLLELLVSRRHPAEHVAARPDVQRRQLDVRRELRLLRRLLLALALRLHRSDRRLVRRPLRCALPLPDAMQVGSCHDIFHTSKSQFILARTTDPGDGWNHCRAKHSGIVPSVSGCVIRAIMN